MSIQARIKLARKEAGYRSQREFAPVIGVGRETLGRYETNEDSLTLEAIRNIAKATSRPLAWFFLEDDWILVRRNDHGSDELFSTIERMRRRLIETDEDLYKIEALTGAKNEKTPAQAGERTRQRNRSEHWNRRKKSDESKSAGTPG